MIKSRRITGFIAACAFSILATPSYGMETEVGFSPDGEAEQLVLKVIDHAQKDIRIMAYSFTSPSVIKELVKARHRGVVVSVVADSSNLKSKSGISALSTLHTAGAKIRTVSKFKILHDKVTIIDGKTVQTGSFNYSKSAAKSNSENVIVLWNATDIAKKYTSHWQSRWDLGEEFKTHY